MKSNLRNKWSRSSLQTLNPNFAKPMLAEWFIYRNEKQ